MSKLKNLFVILIVLGITGWLRMPIEQKLADELHELRLVPPRLSLEDRSRLKQKAFVATYGSLRPTIAAFMSSSASHLHSNQEWDKIENRFDEILLLDPYNFYYWDTASWHMAYNAAVAKQEDDSLTEVAKKKVFEKYIQKGKDILERGMKINPDNWKFLDALSRLEGSQYRNPDYPAAIETDKKLLTTPNLPSNVVRNVNLRILYNLQNIPERYQEAYDFALELFHKGGDYRTQLTLNQIFIGQNHPLTKVKKPLSVEQIYGTNRYALKLLRSKWSTRDLGPKPYGVEEMIRSLETLLNVPAKERTFQAKPLFMRH